MDNNLSKLQIRARVLSALSDLKSDLTITQSGFLEYISTLKEIEDKDSLFDILIKELNKAQEITIEVIKATLSETIPHEYLKEKIISLLTSKQISDQNKYHLVQILKDIGSPIDYDKFFTYFSDPDSMLDYDTQKLLEIAIVNPETQIDFLDFLTALPDSDKLTLIDSLYEDYQDDNLANILIPILYSDFSSDVLKRTIEILGSTKSSIAIEPLEWVYDNSEDPAITALAKKNLNILKLAGASENKANTFYKLILSNSEVYKCYTTIPDGHGNQGIVFTRVREDETYQVFALVINHTYGLVDCFGFNMLGLSELERIISRFCKSEMKIEVSAEYCKTLINKAITLTKIMKEKFTYEFICWSLLIKDVEELGYSIEDWTKLNLKPIELNESKLKKLYNEDYLDKWFFTTSDSEQFKKMIDEFTLDADLNLKKIEDKIAEYFELIWESSLLQKLDVQIINTAYLINILGDTENAQTLYSILNDKKAKEEMMINIIKKSVYEHFALVRQNIKEVVFTTNIFRANKEKKDEKIDIKKVETIIKSIEAKWVNQ